MCGRLPGLPHLPQLWREPLQGVLPAAAGKGLVVDCRSAEFQDAWRPSGELAERTVLVRVLRSTGDGRGAASYGAKRTRGLVARQIARDGLNPRRPDQLAEGLSATFEVELHPPSNRRDATWELLVTEPAPTT
jgi:hypothetical protein